MASNAKLMEAGAQVAAMIAATLPKGMGYVLLVGTGNQLVCVSSGKRNDVIRILREYADQAEKMPEDEHEATVSRIVKPDGSPA